MSVTSRFYVVSATKNAYDPNARQVVIQAVSRGVENKQWATATPAGKIEMTVNNPDAALWFDERVGKDLVITFEDRPLVCEECKQETTFSDSATYNDRHLHHTCR